MDILNALELPVALFSIVASFILAIIVFLHNSRCLSNILFSLLALSMTLWQATNYLSLHPYFLNDLFWIRSVMLLAVGQALLSLLFVRSFPSRKINLKLLNSVILLISAVAVMILCFTPLVFKGVEYINDTPSPVPGSGMPIFALYTFGLLGWALVSMIKRFRVSRNIERTQWKFIGTGVIMMFVLIILFNFIFVNILDINAFVIFSPLFVLPFVVLSSYAVVKHQLLNIKVITTELFVSFILFMLIIQLFFITDRIVVFINIVILTLVSLIAYLLIRSVLKEVRRREEIEALNKKILKQSKTIKENNVYLKKLYEMRSEFLDIAGHQLRTPVSVIKGVASMWRDGDMETMTKEKRQDFIESVYRKSLKLESIIRDILSASEMDSTEFKFVLNDEIEPLQLVQKAVDEFKYQAEEKGLKLIFKAPKKKIPPIISHRTFLYQAVSNLIDNAIIYTKAGKIEVKMDTVNGDLVISVSDTGIGIPPKDIPKLFDKFVRASNARDMHTDGSGLGLFIIKRIAEVHPGGSVDVKSTLGKGTTFTIKIPLK